MQLLFFGKTKSLLINCFTALISVDSPTSNQQNYIIFWKQTSFCFVGQVEWCKVFPFTQDPDALKNRLKK